MMFEKDIQEFHSLGHKIKWNKKYDYKAPVRVDGPTGRMYSVNNEKLPSVTTILGQTRTKEKEENLAKWRQRVGEKEADKIRDNAAARGTIMHRILEGYIKNEGHMDMSELGQEAGVMAQNLIDSGFKNSIDEVWGMEMMMYYPGLFAGACDIAGIYEGKEAIMDFKQSNKWKKREWIDDYFIQTAAYAMAHNHVYGSNINSGVILISVKGGEILKYVSSGKEFQGFCIEWIKRVNKYYEKNVL
tara:strand:+ start:4314 stop:5045 length:732 start_codon:yes stop_codon:yes gene_type:complete